MQIISYCRYENIHCVRAYGLGVSRGLGKKRCSSLERERWLGCCQRNCLEARDSHDPLHSWNEVLSPKGNPEAADTNTNSKDWRYGKQFLIRLSIALNVFTKAFSSKTGSNFFKYCNESQLIFSLLCKNCTGDPSNRTMKEI